MKTSRLYHFLLIAFIAALLPLSAHDKDQDWQARRDAMEAKKKMDVEIEEGLKTHLSEN